MELNILQIRFGENEKYRDSNKNVWVVKDR